MSGIGREHMQSFYQVIIVTSLVYTQRYLRDKSLASYNN